MAALLRGQPGVDEHLALAVGQALEDHAWTGGGSITA
jgi:hypothetical protein